VNNGALQTNIFIQMQKEKSKTQNYNIARNVGVLILFFFTLFSFGKNVYADEIIYLQPDSDVELQTTSSWCFVALSKPPCLATFTLSESKVFEYGVSKLVIYGVRKTGTPSSPAINISNSAVTQYVNFSIGGNIDGTTDEYEFMSYSGDDGGTSTTLSAGTYYVWFNQDVDEYHYYANTGDNNFAGYISADGSSPPPPDTSTRITSFTYATSTRIANVQGYWNTHASSTERLSFWQDSAMLGQESYEEYYATTTGAFNFSFEFLGLPTPYSGSTTTAPFVAPYTLNARITEIYSDFNPFSGEGTPPVILASTSTVVSTLTYDLPDYTTGAGLAEYPEYECAITSITGCLKNAGIWLFYPASDSVEKFKSLNDTLAGKFPFAYAYQAPSLVNKLWTSTQTASSTVSVNVNHFGTITFLSSSMMSAVPYANTIKTIIGWLLWIMTVEFIYFRVIRAHDPHTPK